MKKVLKPVFSKKILGTIILILQIVLFCLTLDKLYEYRVYIYGGTTLISALVILWEINREVDPAFKIIWIALVAIVPFFGVFLYLYVHLDVFHWGAKKSIKEHSEAVKKYYEEIPEGITEITKNEPDEAGIFNYLYRHAFAPCFCKSKAEYFSLGEKAFKRLIEDIKSAEKYIFLEFFILNQNSALWKEIHEILKAKAEAGVEVRIIYDGMGSLTCTTNDFEEMLNAENIQCKIFSPVKPFLSTYHNNRDHRKIAVIDGKCAYTGGVNIADEYVNAIKRFGHWKDTAVRVTGDAVKGFVLMYLKIWDMIGRETSDFGKYLGCISPLGFGDGYIVPFDDNPLDDETVAENVYLHMVNNARRYIYITTPYLILDDDLCDSLKFAAKRGVDVRITMPHIPDKWYAFALARTYYPELIKAGVKIYEYTPGFVHAKSTVSDGVKAFVGSANYDFRSLYLHYECGVYMYKCSVIEDIVKDYERTLEKCSLFTMQDYKNINIFYRLAGRIFRLFAPLM